MVITRNLSHTTSAVSVVSAVLLMAAASAAPPVAPAPHPVLYMMSTAGDSRTYRNWQYDGTHRAITHTISTVEPHPRGGWLVTTRQRFTVPKGLLVINGVESPERVYEDPHAKDIVTTDGVSEMVEIYKHDRWEPAPVQRGRPLILPGKIGDTATLEQPAIQYIVKNTNRGPERVTELAGTFDAIRVECEATFEGQPQPHRTLWYAPRVGLVKSEVNGVKVMELLSFTPGTGPSVR